MDQNLNPKRIKYFKIGAIITFIIFLFLYFILNFFSLSIIERGPRLYIFLFILEIIFLIITVLLGFSWIHTLYGFRKSKYYIIGIAFCFIIILAGFTISNYQLRKEYSYITVDNVKRQYIVHLPTDYSSTTSYPLLLALHGGTGNAKQFEDQSGFNTIADKYHFIVVYPDGLGLFEFNFHIWNSGYIGTSLDGGVNDVSFLYNLILKLESDYSMNTSRVYMTGHSNGAMMTYRMAAEYPRLFASVASVAGSIGGKTTPTSESYIIPTPNASVNVIEIHGLQDTNILYNGGVTKTGYNAGQRYDDSVNQTISFWTSNDNCSQIPLTKNSTDNTILLQTYSGGVNITNVKLVTIANQNNFWENLNKEVAKEKFYGTTLAEMIWNLLNTT